MLGSLEHRICPRTLVKATQEVNTLGTGVETAFVGSQVLFKGTVTP